MQLMWKFFQFSCGRNIIRRTLVHKVTADTAKPEVHEVTIPVPWGYVAGRWWGDKKGQPIIALHGVEDNAASFNLLIPLLAAGDIPVFAIDIPGHGKSDHLPPGVPPHYTDNLVFLRYLVKHHYPDWKNLILMGHSFGSSICYAYAALYPDDVERFISIECSRLMMASNLPEQMKKTVEKILLCDKLTNEPPSYNFEELLTVFHRGRKERLSLESCKLLLDRSVVESKINKGKWWGDANSKYRPILAIHGWQDNAGSFDNLMEHLVTERPVLAIDMPGHGWSSHIYPTMIYHEIDMVLLIRRIQKYYGWEKVSFLTHSMGGISSFLFSSLYPEFVDFVINLDLMKPFEREMNEQANMMGGLVDRIIDLMMRTPSHTGWSADELRERWVKGTGNSLTEESARVLMKRGIKEVSPGKYVYSRDPRVKAWPLHRFECSENVRLAKNIKCPVLLINANKSPFWRLSTDSCPEIVNTMKESCKSFDVITLNGTHHIHLNDPECVAPVISEFLYKVKTMI